MSRYRIAVVFLLVVASCGSNGGSETTTSAEPTASLAANGPTTSSIPDTTLESITDARSRAEDYLFDLANILGEADNRTQVCQEGVSAGAQITEGSPPAAVEEFLQAMFADCMVGIFESTTEMISGLDPPDDLAAQHDDYVSSRQAWVAVASELGKTLVTFEDAEAIFVDPDFIVANDAVGSGCRGLESAAAAAGFVVSLTCPGAIEQPESEPVQITFDGSGVTVDPPGAIDAGGGVMLVITNTDGTAHQPVVATLFSGHPAHLPLRGSGVDVKESGVVSSADDSDPDRGYFGLNWPEVTGEDWDGTVPDLAPGDTISVAVLSGEYVIFDQAPGAYEAGRFSVLVVASGPEIEATYVAPPNAAESCEQLADVLTRLYAAYVDEVTLLSADDFGRSPLSMIDDLRFGAALQRSQQLDCDPEALRAAATAQLCSAKVPEESAAAVIVEHACGEG